MQFLINEIKQTLIRFMSMPGDDLLLLICDAQHSPILLKTIDALEGDPGFADIFLTFSQPFDWPRDYATKIIESVTQQSEYVNKELVKRGDTALADPPPKMHDVSVPLPERLLLSMRYVRQVVPAERKIAWALFPEEVREPEKFVQVVSRLRAWVADDAMRGAKLIVRDSASAPVLAPLLRGQPGVQAYQPELEPGALETRLEKESNNAQLSAEERAQVHMMLAGMDVAHKRFDKAMARNQELLGYFYHSGQKYQQAIVLNNIGDLLYIQGQFAESQEWYERAVALSLELKSQPLVLCQSINLGNALLALKRHDEALPYYQAAARLAEASNAPIHQIQALERIGDLTLQADRKNEAIAAWQKAAEISNKLHYKPGEKTALEHLQVVFVQLGDVQRLKECQAALAKLPS